MEMDLAAPIVLLIQGKFCWCEVKEGKCGLEFGELPGQGMRWFPGGGIAAGCDSPTGTGLCDNGTGRASDGSLPCPQSSPEL